MRLLVYIHICTRVIVSLYLIYTITNKVKQYSKLRIAQTCFELRMRSRNVKWHNVMYVKTKIGLKLVNN